MMIVEAGHNHQIKAPGAHDASAGVEGGDGKVKTGSAVPGLRAEAMQPDRLGF